MEFATRAIHAGQEADAAAGDVVPPLHLSTIYAYDAPGVMRAGYEYSRYGNPTRAALEACLAALENAPADCPALCFSSGMAATDCALRLLRPGDRLLMAEGIYGGTTRLVEQVVRPAGIEVAYADAADTEAFVAARAPGTRLVWIETPSNPLLRLTDIAAVAEAAHRAGALLAVDSTFGTPCFQNPLDLGADLVMHSTTKYLGGHSDLLGGALIVRDAGLRRQLYDLQKTTGAVASPFDCWLTLRGVRTLAARMRVHESNALAIARFLQAHPRVIALHYPGLEDHPQHALAKRQMRGFGGMVPFEIEGGEEAARAVLQRTKLFTLAASLGGVESIISYPPLMSHAALTREERHRRGIQDGLIRLSVGLEDAKDLIADLDQALA
ncbi:MAG TPA: aminotransferase class I/II-fold pyridoxal phosphate-dependent enzyme [Chthonomonadaceae bacterium]|nr:aminotransferase class I/II-fold pyridoxal phosphate-dependent enzyme [Chthonomonadaceae bacterium]